MTTFIGEANMNIGGTATQHTTVGSSKKPGVDIHPILALGFFMGTIRIRTLMRCTLGLRHINVQLGLGVVTMTEVFPDVFLSLPSELVKQRTFV